MTAQADRAVLALGEEDRAILALESPTVIGHVCHVILLAPGPVDAEAVRDRVRARLDTAPELRYRLGGTPEHPEWEPAAQVDLAGHILDLTGELDPHAEAPSSPPSDAVRIQDHARRRAHLIGFVAREFAVQAHRSPLAGTIGVRRAVAFTDTSLSDLQRMDELNQRLTPLPSVRRLVKALHATPREFAVRVSNIAGPRGPATILGRPVDAVRPVAEIGERHALRVGAVTTGDTLSFGLCVDPGIVADVDRLGDGLEREIALLVTAARDRP